MATGQGTATLAFGTASSRTTDVSVAVTGQTSISGTSKCEAYFMDDTTSDHSADEHIMASSMIDVVCGSVVAGAGFTIFALVRDEISKAGLTGDFKIRWVWAD